MYSSSETLRNCEAIIARHASVMMRCGWCATTAVHRSYTQEVRAALVAEVRAHPERRVAAIAVDFGVPVPTAQGWVRMAGGKGSSVRGGRAIGARTAGRIARAQSLRAQGMTLGEIGLEMGVWPGSVRYLLMRGAKL